MGKAKKAGLVTTFALLFALSFGSASANSTTPTTSLCPSVMPKGTVCLTTEELATLRRAQETADLALADMTFAYKKAKVKGRRFGGVLGCGGVIYFQIEDSDMDLDLAPACGVLYGWRF